MWPPPLWLGITQKFKFILSGLDADLDKQIVVIREQLKPKK